jgi:hypothetical protein
MRYLISLLPFSTIFCHVENLFLLFSIYFNFLFPPVSEKAIEKCYYKKEKQKTEINDSKMKAILFNNFIITSAIAENFIKYEVKYI